MTRWMLLALLACASAQDVDRLQQATRALEKAARDSNSPTLAALAVKSATTSGGSALTKVIKFIDEAYNTIQDQITKETEANTECVAKTNENQHKLDKLNRERMQSEADISTADTDFEDAKSQIAELSAALDAQATERSERFSTFTETAKNFNAELSDLAENIKQVNNVVSEMKSQVEAAANDASKKDAFEKALDIFKTISTRSQEQYDTTAGDLKNAEREYSDFVRADDRAKKDLETNITKQKADQKAAQGNADSARDALLRTNKNLAQTRSLRKDIDSQCVKTTVNHEDRAKQRQSEIDSLKQVKEILSQ